MKSGMTFAPQGKPRPVVKHGEFVFAATALEHGHIYGMVNGLLEAGGALKYVYDPDPQKVKHFLDTYKDQPNLTAADSLQQILDDKEVCLVAAAAITNDRGPLGVKVMQAGKDYFTDKAPMTTLQQLQTARETVKATGKKFMCYYSERLHTESGIYAGQLIDSGAIGRVIQVIGLGPHRLSKANRPPWFFVKEQYGGILCDIGSHQFESFLHYTGAKDAKIVASQVANYNNPDYPELEDFGDATLLADNGATGYFRVDWFTPDGLSTWGDGRMFIMGTDGFIELRKYCNIGVSPEGDNVYVATKDKEEFVNVAGKVGFPFFGQLILDCLNRTETAMTQEHCFKAAELCLQAQAQAVKIN